MRDGVLIISHEDISGEIHYYGYALVEGRTLSLSNYDLEDDSLNQKKCEVEDDGMIVTRLVVDGVEIPRKQSSVSSENSQEEMSSELPSTENMNASGVDEGQFPGPEIRNRETFAFHCAYRRIKRQKVENYSEQVNTLPMLIKHNGLGAALMYMRIQKTGNALSDIYEDISDWIRHDEKQLIELGNDEELVEKIIEAGQEQYKDVTREVLAYLAFLKRFAKGLSP